MREALALGDRHGRVGALGDEAGERLVVAASELDVEAGILKRCDIATHGALARAGLGRDIADPAAVFEAAQRVQHVEGARDLAELTAAIHGGAREEGRPIPARMDLGSASRRDSASVLRRIGEGSR
jgi:hypothetical protein